jgi:hypothetical protein
VPLEDVRKADSGLPVTVDLVLRSLRQEGEITHIPPHARTTHTARTHAFALMRSDTCAGHDRRHLAGAVHATDSVRMCACTASGTRELGIFRQSGSRKLVRELKEQLDLGTDCVSLISALPLRSCVRWGSAHPSVARGTGNLVSLDKVDAHSRGDLLKVQPHRTHAHAHNAS